MMRRFFVLFFAAATGYISLSQEMIWMRAISYMTGGEPTVFAHVLGLFLLGVAGGALYGQWLCQGVFPTASRGPVRFIGAMLLASAAFYYLSVAGVAHLLTLKYKTAGVVIDYSWLGVPAMYAVVAGVSFLLGGIFTVLCHFGARAGEEVGITVSRIYLANIIGSTLGPLITGFVLMDIWSMDQIILAISAATALLGVLALLYDAESRPLIPVALCFFALAFVLHGPLYDDVLARLQYQGGYWPGAYKYLKETRSGIIAVQHGEKAANGGPDLPDSIFGGGMYDGRFNTDVIHQMDTNWIDRAYMIAGLHPDPRDVLEIGLSSASWTRVLANYVPTRRLTTVEINPGYKEIIEHYPDQASILTDPKVTVEFDDGRRWLNRHPDARFDFILQNTTWHWRSEITNLLSVEYLELCKQHLKPGGVLYWNTTHSDDVRFTAAHVFKHVVLYSNFVAASDSPFELTGEQIRARLQQFTDGGRAGDKPIFDPADPAANAALDYMAHPLHDVAAEFAARTDLKLITDDNMATEFKRKRSDLDAGQDRQKWFSGNESWLSFIQRRSQNLP